MSSPRKEAWLRLRRDPKAMLGLIAVVAMGLASLVAPWLSPCPPDELRPWLGAQPPGATHPLTSAEDVFVVGRPPEAPAALRAASHLAIDADEWSYREYRLALRGKALEIRGAGAALVPRLDLDAPGQTAAMLAEDGATTPLTLHGTLMNGKPPPDGLFAPGQGVLYLRQGPPPRAVRCEVSLADGKVVSISRGGDRVQSLTLKAADVRLVEADGRPLTLRHPLGTDLLGRDLLARVLHGGRISFSVGLGATAVALAIGVLYGAVSGYAGGRIDRLMMSTVDVLDAIPFMFLVIVLMVALGQGPAVLVIALAASQWLGMARIVRGQVLSLAGREFVDAARMAGAGHWAIVHRHLVPNALGPVIVAATLAVPSVILSESFLAFIGLSVRWQGQPLESWGALVKDGMDALSGGLGRSWLLLFPSLAMALTLFALNCLGDGLRDALDPRLRGKA